MKVYYDTNTKDVKTYVLYADSKVLYHDSDCKNGVTATELADMFDVGIIIVGDDDIVTRPIAFVPASAVTEYATLSIPAVVETAVAMVTYYTVEYLDT